MNLRRITLKVLNTSDVLEPSDTLAGFAGEHLATQLIFELPPEWANDVTLNYYVSFLTQSGFCCRTDKLTWPVSVLLPSAVMTEGTLLVQLSATSGDGTATTTIKSAVCSLIIGKSVAGNTSIPADYTGLLEAKIEEFNTVLATLKETAVKAPYIGTNNNWFVYDTTTAKYTDTGINANGITDYNKLDALPTLDGTIIAGALTKGALDIASAATLATITTAKADNLQLLANNQLQLSANNAVIGTPVTLPITSPADIITTGDNEYRRLDSPICAPSKYNDIADYGIQNYHLSKSLRSQINPNRVTTSNPKQLGTQISGAIINESGVHFKLSGTKIIGSSCVITVSGKKNIALKHNCNLQNAKLYETVAFYSQSESELIANTSGITPLYAIPYEQATGYIMNTATKNDMIVLPIPPGAKSFAFNDFVIETGGPYINSPNYELYFDVDIVPTETQRALATISTTKADDIQLLANNQLQLVADNVLIGTPINLPTPKWSLIGKIDVDIDAPLGIAWWNFKNLPNFKKIYLKYVGLKNKNAKKEYCCLKLNDTSPSLEVIFAGENASNGLCGYLVADVIPNGVIYQSVMGVESPTSYWLGSSALISNNPFPIPDIVGINSIMCGNGAGLLSAGKIEMWGLT